jgi:hypothetical protein
MLGGLFADIIDGNAHAVKETDACQVHIQKEGGLDCTDDGGGFGMGYNVVHAKMTGQDDRKVRHSDGRVTSVELAEKEVERHRLVGDRSVNGWSGESLDRDSGGAMANADGSVLRRGR